MQGNTVLNRFANHLPLIFMSALVLCSIFIIIQFGSGRAPLPNMDQAFVYVDLRIYRHAGHWEFQYPHLSYAGGITGSLLVGIYKLVIPTDPGTLNYHVKILAALAYFSSTYVLARLFLDKTLDQLIVLAILGSAGLHFIEPTIEVISACFMNLLLIAAKRHWPIIVQAAFLSIFSLIKAELVPLGAAVALVWTTTVGQTWRERALFLLAFAGLDVVLLSPSLYLYGPIGSRGFPALQIAYCNWYLIDHAACAKGTFKTISSFSEFVWLKPFDYVHFLILSLPHTSLNALGVLGIFVVAFPVAIGLVRWSSLSPIERLLLGAVATAVVISFIMGAAVGHMKPRYMTRAYCILAVATFFCLERIALQKRWVAQNFIMISLVIGMLVIVPNLLRLPAYIAESHYTINNTNRLPPKSPAK